jgi:acetyl esterase
MSAQLDPEAQALLDVMQATGGSQPYASSVDEARQQMRAALVTRGAPLALRDVRDLELPSPHGPLRLRLYRPSEGALPVALFLHGGGWTLNDLDTHDRLCRRIARRSGWLLASLDYRRAPEHRHPAPLHDAHLAYRWLRDNRERIGGNAIRDAVIGESAGATTAAALTLLLRDAGAPLPSMQVLAYPLTDVPGRWPSHNERGNGYTLDSAFIRWFFEQYLGAEHPLSDPNDRIDADGDTPLARDPYLLPLTAPDLSGLPPAFVMTAEFDPLRDEGLAYARRLSEAGVTVEHVHAEDQMHGFLLLDRAIPRAGELIDRLADALAAHARERPVGHTIAPRMLNAEEMLALAATRSSELAVPDMSSRPSRRVAVLTCMDVRIDPSLMLGLARGEAHVIRNAGGLVTEDAIRSLSASQRLLGSQEIVVVMHEGCGLHGASEDEFARALAADDALPSWRLGAFADVEATLRQGLDRLRSSPELPVREHIRGLVFDPRSGSLREVPAGAGTSMS